MTEKTLRKYHAALGAILSIFILIQVGSGTLIAFNEFLGRGHHTHNDRSHDNLHDDSGGHNGQTREDNLLQIIHHHGKQPLQALRVLLGLGVLIMAISGTTIYVMVYNRKKQLSDKAL